MVLATAGAAKGSIVPTWIDASGAITSPPLNHRDIVGDVLIAVVTTCFVSWLVLLALSALARRARTACAERLGCRVAGERPALERSPALRPVSKKIEVKAAAK